MDVTEAEIKALGLPFGRVTNILLMRTKSQAFLELQDCECSKTMINYYQYCTPQVRMQNVSIVLDFVYSFFARLKFFL